LAKSADHPPAAARGGYAPTDGLAYDPEDPRYWDEAALHRETARVFDVCAGCRMCFKYCDAFPKLFATADGEHGGDARALTRQQTEAVMNDCFQCKQCEVNCPYSPRDAHPFAVDFPKLAHRHKAQQARQRGLTLRERVLSNPDAVGLAARLGGGLANRLNRNTAHRLLLEKTLGIHRDKQLPVFAPRTFEAWAVDEGLTKGAPGAEVVLFQSCYVDSNEPEIGRDTIEVLRANRVEVRCVRGLGCCGMPAWECGDLPELRRRARRNLDLLLPHVEAGSTVVALGPTCAMMLRREYPTLVGPADRERAAKLAAAVRDPGELLLSIRTQERAAPPVVSRPERVAYHLACHQRAQAIGFPARQLLRRAGVAEVVAVGECCGHDGSYAMKVESFEAARRIGRKAFDGMRDAGAATWITDCPLAAIQIEQNAGTKPLHPMSLLARAYRGDEFPGQTRR
jgi:glycerol-3-phosphate dehydrogenase subunit C